MANAFTACDRKWSRLANKLVFRRPTIFQHGKLLVVLRPAIEVFRGKYKILYSHAGSAHAFQPITTKFCILHYVRYMPTLVKLSCVFMVPFPILPSFLFSFILAWAPEPVLTVDVYMAQNVWIIVILWTTQSTTLECIWKYIIWSYEFDSNNPWL